MPLVCRTVSGEQEAFEQLMYSLKSIISLKIRRHIECPEDVEDIGQEVAIRIFQCIGSLKHPEAFESWLHTLVARECLRYFSSNLQKDSFESFSEYDSRLIETDEDYMPLARAERLDMQHEIENVLGRMPEVSQKMVALHYGDEMCYREIAEYLGVSIGTVSSILFRVRRKLRKELYRS